MFALVDNNIDVGLQLIIFYHVIIPQSINALLFTEESIIIQSRK